MKKNTINKIAEIASVSPATVSAVLNSKSTVKSSTRKKVLSVMKELDIKPKSNAKHLSTSMPTKTIGLIVKDLSNPFFSSVALGVKKYANSKGYLVFITSTENQLEYESAATNVYTNSNILGTIISPIIEYSSEIGHLFRLKSSKFPFVLLEEIPGIQANVVTYANAKPITDLVKHLMEIGHKKILHFSGPTKISSHALARINGFKQAFAHSTMAFDKKMIVDIGIAFNESRADTIKYINSLAKEDYPTAIVCFNDQQAYGVISGLYELGLKVPEDISVTGVDDITFSELFSVPLTTIRIPQFELGSKAAEVLINNIELKGSVEPVNIQLETQLVLRDSIRNLI